MKIKVCRTVESKVKQQKYMNKNMYSNVDLEIY